MCGEYDKENGPFRMQTFLRIKWAVFSPKSILSSDIEISEYDEVSAGTISDPSRSKVSGHNLFE